MRLIKKYQGFSLIELAVVMVIISLVMALAIPQFNKFTNRRKLDSEIHQWVAYTRYARCQAILQSVQYKLNYDIDQQKYWLTYQNYAEANEPMEIRPMGYWGKTEILDPTVRLVSIQINQENIYESGIVEISFNSRGRTLDSIFTFQNQDGDKRIVQLNGLTGEINVISETL